MNKQLIKSSFKDTLKKKFEFLFEEALLEEMSIYGKQVQFKANALIIDIGDEIEFIPLVLDGSIKVLTEDKEGDELLLYYLESGDSCAVTLNCCSRLAKSNIRAFAESDVNMLFIPSDRMDYWMIHFQSWRAYVLDNYNTRLTEMFKALDSIVFSSLEDRLLKYLRDKAWVSKSATLNITHKDIANDLHSSRVVISRLLKKIEQNGLITQTRNKIEYLEFSNT